MNRRMRNRTYGGVRGRRGQVRPLLDWLPDIQNFELTVSWVPITVCRDSEKLTFSARRQSRHQLADSASCWRGEHASPKSLWVCQKISQRASSQPATAATATTSTGDWRPYTNKPNAANASPKSPRE